MAKTQEQLPTLLVEVMEPQPGRGGPAENLRSAGLDREDQAEIDPILGPAYPGWAELVNHKRSRHGYTYFPSNS